MRREILFSPIFITFLFQLFAFISEGEGHRHHCCHCNRQHQHQHPPSTHHPASNTTAISSTTKVPTTTVNINVTLLRERAKREFVRPGGPTVEDIEYVFKLIADANKRYLSVLTELDFHPELDERFAQKWAIVRQQQQYRIDHPEVMVPLPSVVTFNSGIQPYLFQVDLFISPKQAKQLLSEKRVHKREAFNPATHPDWLWTKANVPYIFDETIDTDQKALIHRGINQWQDSTCLTFSENPNAKNKIVISAYGVGCWSAFGRQEEYANQTANFHAGTPGCFQIGIIAHILGHAVGLYHEQSRVDRDQYIKANFSIVNPDLAYNFMAVSSKDNENFNVPYDYGSVMQSQRNAFALDKVSSTMYTISEKVSTEWDPSLGSRLGPTITDLREMNALYKCKCSKPIECLNGGFQNPKQCANCVCPPGIGGKRCEQFLPPPIQQGFAPPGVPNTCNGSSLLVNSKNWSELFGQIGSTDNSSQTNSDFAWCHWHLHAKPGKKIVIEVLEIGQTCAFACFVGFTEIRIGNKNDDFGLTGRRACCQADLLAQGGNILTYTSAKNNAIISLFASIGVQRFHIRYKQL